MELVKVKTRMPSVRLARMNIPRQTRWLVSETIDRKPLTLAAFLSLGRFVDVTTQDNKKYQTYSKIFTKISLQDKFLREQNLNLTPFFI